MRRELIAVILSFAFVVSQSGSAVADLCDDLTISKDWSNTWCRVLDAAGGKVTNQGSSNPVTCVAVWFTWSVNLATVELIFGDSSAEWDGESELVSTCTVVGANSYELWEVHCTRDNWNDDAAATLIINYPCPRDRWLEKSVTVWWPPCN